MGKCCDCDMPELCLAFRTAEEYIAPDGELRQIVGCNTEAYEYGDILTSEMIAQIGKERLP